MAYTLHGKISEAGMMHNRSDYQRSSPPSLQDFKNRKKEFEELREKIARQKRSNSTERENNRKNDLIHNW